MTRQSDLLATAGDDTPVDAYVKLSRQHRRSGDLKRAEAVLSRGRAKHACQLEWAVEFAEVAMARRDWPAAVDRWKAALETEGADKTIAYVGLARASRRQGELEHAEAVLQCSGARHSGHLHWAVEFAEVAMARRDWSTAAARWQQLIETHGDQAPAVAYAALARAHRERGDVETAEEILRQTEARHGNELAWLIEFTQVAVARGDWASVLTRSRAALEAHGERVPARIYLNLAQAYRQQGALQPAEAVLRNGRTRWPEDRAIAVEFAELATARQDWQAALDRWIAVLLGFGTKAPPRSYERIAEAVTSMSPADRHAALHSLKASLNSRQGSACPEMYAALCRTCRRLGQPARAFEIARQGLRLHPNDVHLLAEAAVLDNFLDDVRSCASGQTRRPRIEIVICVHNALAETQRCLEAIVRSTDGPYHITIVDDHSEPAVGASLDTFASSFPHARVIHSECNRGYTKSANLGIKAARCDWVVLLNSDTIVTAGWLEGLFECALSHPQIRAVGPLSNAATVQSVPETRAPDRSFVINELPDNFSPEDVAGIIRQQSRKAFPRVPVLNGFCLLLHRPALEAVGLFDEARFPRGYGEENDLCLRLLSAGYKLAVADHVYVYHSKSASFGSIEKRALTTRGGRELRRLWPGYSYAFITDAMEDIPALKSLKERIRGQFAFLGAG